ncbi:hypothetical protein BaRGS_00025214 [Batillaria attramentaria]|uniref:Uncharacterized protein n=1 Tax=Batillaria attramentaria TaxID=370345 RepID=A0ABD0K8U1_9CAEN
MDGRRHKVKPSSSGPVISLGGLSSAVPLPCVRPHDAASIQPTTTLLLSSACCSDSQSDSARACQFHQRVHDEHVQSSSELVSFRAVPSRFRPAVQKSGESGVNFPSANEMRFVSTGFSAVN